LALSGHRRRDAALQLLTDAVDKRFRGVSEQHCFKRGVELATLIQKTRHLDSIVARALLVSDFIDSIDP